MAKRARTERRQAERAERKASKPEVDHSKRNFLIGAGALAGTMLVGGAVYKTCQRTNLSYDHSFVIHPDDIPQRTIETFEELNRLFAPIGPWIEVHPSSLEYSELSKKLQPHLESGIRQGRLIEGTYDLYANTRIYGAPAEHNIAQSAVEYCKRAHAFLLEEVPELQEEKTGWIIVSGTPVTDYNQKGFIGAYHYEALEAKLIHREDPSQTMLYHEISRGQGAKFLSEYDSDNNIFNYWFMVLPANANLILAVYSEIINAYITKEAAEYMVAEQDGIGGRLALEAMGEAAARILAEKMVEKENIEDGMLFIERLVNTYLPNPQYELVPAATEWMRGQGVREAFRLWKQEGVKAFMEEIRL